MFTAAVLCLLLAILAGIFGYSGIADATLAGLAQHGFLIMLVGFAVCAIAVITGLDEKLMTYRASASPDETDQPATSLAETDFHPSMED